MIALVGEQTVEDRRKCSLLTRSARMAFDLHAPASHAPVYFFARGQPVA